MWIKNRLKHPYSSYTQESSSDGDLNTQNFKTLTHGLVKWSDEWTKSLVCTQVWVNMWIVYVFRLGKIWVNV